MTAASQYPSRDQAMAALQIANAVRVERAKLHQQIHAVGNYRDSCIALAMLFQSELPSCMSRMRVDQALRWVYHMGPTKVRACLVEAECSPYKKVGDLTPRQRERIAGALLDSPCVRAAA